MPTSASPPQRAPSAAQATEPPQPVSRTAISARTVSYLAFSLVALHLLTRTWVAANSGFYWDDLILIGRGATLPLWSADLLAYSHDGHLMPGAFWVASISATIAPYEWAFPAVTLVLGQLATSLAVLRLLTTILGRRPTLLIPLTFYLFVPLTIPAYTWWAAALNSLPLQFALAWVSADAIRLYRTRARRYCVSSILVLVVALLFFEKSVVVPIVAFATVTLLGHVAGRPAPLASAWRRCRSLWIGALAVLAVWTVAFLSVPFAEQTHLNWPSPDRLLGLAHHGTSFGLVPTMLGGPWMWERWLPGPPWATPSTGFVVIAWIVVLAAIAASMRYKRRVGGVWAGATLYYLASIAAMALARWSDDTAYELAQTLRYFTDTAVIITIALALTLRAPARNRALAPSLAGRRGVAITTTVGAAFVVSSLISTVTYIRCWQEGPTPHYLANARNSLAEHSDAPLLDQQMPIEILMPITHPNNWLSLVLAPLRDRPEFSASTTELRLVDASGKLVDAQVLWTRAIEPGPDPQCETRIEGSNWTTVALNGPLVEWYWVAQLNYLATTDGELEVIFANHSPNEKPVRVPVSAGLGTVYVALAGGGDNIQMRPVTPGLTVCLAPGPVGSPAPK